MSHPIENAGRNAVRTGLTVLRTGLPRGGRSCIAILTLLWATALSPSAAPAQQLIFSTLESSPADPGAFSTLSCRVEYDAHPPAPRRDLIVRFVPPPQWRALASERTVSLGPGDSRIIPFTVRVPDQASPDSTYDAMFLLSELERDAVGPHVPSIEGIAIRGLTVNSRYGITLTPSSEELEARAGEEAGISVFARNDGNQTEVVRIDAESVPDWPVRIEPSEITLAPGESRAMFVHVEVPIAARNGALHVLDLTASSRDVDSAPSRARVRTEVLDQQKDESRYRRLPVEASFTAGEIAPGEHRYGLRVLASGGIGANADLGLEADLVAGRRARGIDGWQNQSLRGRLARDPWELTGGDFPIQTNDLTASGFSGRGAQLRVQSGSAKLRILRVRNREDTRAHSWVGSGEHSLPYDFRVGAEVLSRDVEEEIESIDPESDPIQTRHDHVATTTLAWGNSRGTHLSTDLALSRLERPGSQTSGRAAQLAFATSGSRALLRGRFNLGSRGFIGRTGDRDGAVLFGSWAPGGRPIRLWSNLETTDGRIWATGDSTRSVVERVRAGVRWDTQRWPAIEVSAGRLDEETESGDEIASSRRSNLTVSTTVARGPALLVATLDHELVRDRRTDATGSTRSIDLSAGGRIANLRAALHWSQSTDWSPHALAEMVSRGWQADLSYASSNGSYLAGASVSRRQQDTESVARTPVLLRVEPRLDLRLARSWSLRVDASIDRLDDDARINRWQIALHRSPIELLPMPWVPLRGGVRGVVFIDQDGDGQPGPDEARVADVVVRADGRYQTTDRNGEFSWPSLDPGTYWLELDRGSIPGGLTCPLVLPIELVIDAGRDQDLWIPLSPSSTVRGRIFLDEDFDGVSTGEEAAIPDLRIALWRGDAQVSVAMSDETGGFVFRQVPPGRYELRIDPQWIPRGWEPTSREVWVEVDEGGSIVPPYGIAPRRKPIIITYPGKREVKG